MTEPKFQRNQEVVHRPSGFLGQVIDHALASAPSGQSRWRVGKPDNPVNAHWFPESELDPVMLSPPIAKFKVGAKVKCGDAVFLVVSAGRINDRELYTIQGIQKPDLVWVRYGDEIEPWSEPPVADPAAIDAQLRRLTAAVVLVCDFLGQAPIPGTDPGWSQAFLKRIRETLSGEPTL